MIITTYLEKDTFFHPEDEKKLNEIENKQQIIHYVRNSKNKIAILDSNIGRILLFDDTYQGGLINYDGFQSGMPYTRYFHLSKIINPDIKNILVLGLGGGSFINESLKLYAPDHIDIVENDQNVIDIAYKYFNLSQDKRIKIHCMDARDFVFNNCIYYDLIVIDVFVADGMPFKFMTLEFLSRINEILSNNGIVGVNFFSTENISSNLDSIFLAEYRTYKEIFDSIYSFPVLYGAYEFFRYCCNFRYKMGELTNVVLLASKNSKLITKSNFIQKAEIIKETNNLPFLKNYKLYAKDFFNQEIDYQNYKIISDNLQINESTGHEDFLQLIRD